MTRATLARLQPLAQVLAFAICAAALLGTITGYTALSGLDLFAGLGLLVMLRSEIRSLPRWFGSRAALLLIPAAVIFQVLTIYVDLRILEPMALLHLLVIALSAALMVSINRARSAI